MKPSYFSHVCLFLLSFISINSYSFDTLHIREMHDDIIIYKYLSIFKDVKKNTAVDSIIKLAENHQFYANNDSKLNFGFSPSTYWVRLIVKNDTRVSLNYILEISNPDLDFISLYEVKNDTIMRTIHTGELADVSSREIYHRNFLFNVLIEPGMSRTYYMSLNNNGHPLYIPLEFSQQTYFERNDNLKELFNWLVYGILLFIVIFNLYLYRSTKDKTNLYYSAALIFGLLYLLHYEGYLYYLNPPTIIEKIKFISPCLVTVFLLSFTQAFFADDKRIVKYKRYLTLLKGVTLISPFFYFLQYPVNLITDAGAPVLLIFTFFMVIILTFIGYKKNYLPSQLFLISFILVFTGLIINQLKEFGFVVSNTLTINSVKIGFTLQNILLTLAVLERFRINQEDSKQLIQNNLIRIELQNTELEIVNAELEKLALLASETDNSIASYDINGRLEWGNAGFERLYGVHINDLIKNSRDKIEYIIPNEHILQYVKKCLETQMPVTFETPLMTDKRKKRWIQTTLSPFVRSKKLHKIIAIDTNITSLKTYEKKLEIAKEKAEESDRLKTAFLHNISHEIRTPMNAIVGFSGFLTNPDLSTEKRNHFTDIIVQSSNQLLDIITDIISIASIEAKQERISEGQLDLNSTMVFLYEQFLPKAKEKNISLNLKPSFPSINENIITDETKLIQILTNLIGNALKFTTKGHIKFGYAIKENELEFFVEDTGIGIISEKHQEIFIRFHQVESSNARHFGGSGLGLSISKAYVELLGGRIWLNSELNKGSVFYFTIPLKRVEKNTLSAKKAGNGSGIFITEELKTLLIVEDEDSNYNLLEELLSGLNINIIRAKNGVEAVEICKSKPVNMILMDVKMPVMDGYEATKQIREFMPHLPIIAQTAFLTDLEKNKALGYGFTDLIIKPFKREHVICIIKDHINK